MRNSKKIICGKKTIRSIYIFICFFWGMGAIGLAFLAPYLGIDHNNTWGLQRSALAGVGLFFLILSLYISFISAFRKFINRLSELPFFKRIIHFLLRIRINASLKNSKISDSKRTIYASWWVAAGSTIVITAGIWLITNGTFFTWAPFTNYFDRLANAFLKGSFALLDKPPSELLALANPYDYQAREGINYIWDSTLFKGKYYLYFGPVPALFALVVKIFGDVSVYDQYLIIFFFAGLIISIGLHLVWVRKTFFPKTPAWTIFPLILIAGLCTPLLWLIRTPNVYEVSILGGQFLLILGLYALLRGLHSRKNQSAWLGAAGFMWGAAVGCRMNYVVAIGLMLIPAAFFLFKDNKKGFLQKNIWLILPMALWAVCLAYYNYARFGSILETGHHYQLTGPAYSSHSNVIFSLKYIVPNIYNMFFRPPEISFVKYPFLYAPYIKENMWPWFIKLPENYYYSEPIIGLFMGTPIFLVVLAPVFMEFARFIGWLNESTPHYFRRSNFPAKRIWIILLSGIIGGILPIVLYIGSTMRYLADFAPLLVILLAIIIWRGWDHLQNRPILEGSFIFLLILLILTSIIISLLVNFFSNRFEVNNPDLYYLIVRKLSRFLDFVFK